MYFYLCNILLFIIIIFTAGIAVTSTHTASHQYYKKLFIIVIYFLIKYFCICLTCIELLYNNCDRACINHPYDIKHLLTLI